MRRDADWNHYTYRYAAGEETRDAHVRFDVGCALAPCPETHQTTARVRVRGPAADLEAQLPELLADIDCWLVGVLRYAGVTAFVFQVEDEGGFAAAEPALVAAAPGPVAIERSPGWSFFEDRVCPSETDWQRIQDREQLERLEAAGVDLHAEIEVLHGFYGGARALEALHEALLAEDFRRHAQEARRLEVLRTHRLADVSSVSVALARFARTRGVAYDGWRPLTPG